MYDYDAGRCYLLLELVEARNDSDRFESFMRVEGGGDTYGYGGDDESYGSDKPEPFIPLAPGRRYKTNKSRLIGQLDGIDHDSCLAAGFAVGAKGVVFNTAKDRCFLLKSRKQQNGGDEFLSYNRDFNVEEGCDCSDACN